MPVLPERNLSQNIMDKLQEMSAEDTEDGQPLTGQDLIDWFWKKTGRLWRPLYKLYKQRNATDTDFNLNE